MRLMMEVNDERKKERNNNNEQVIVTYGTIPIQYNNFRQKPRSYTTIISLQIIQLYN